jgi:hypothetical protein
VGVEGIMSAYTSALYSVSLAGPTMFGPVINKAAEIASHSLQYGNNKYFVLLIITVCNQISIGDFCWPMSFTWAILQDGVLTDIQETKDSIVRASDLPLSILIIGVGNADFKQMEVKCLLITRQLAHSCQIKNILNIVVFSNAEEVICLFCLCYKHWTMPYTHMGEIQHHIFFLYSLVVACCSHLSGFVAV